MLLLEKHSGRSNFQDFSTLIIGNKTNFHQNRLVN
jgi:hypothetical protein